MRAKPIDKATKLKIDSVASAGKSGLFTVYVDEWWVVTEDDEILVDTYGDSERSKRKVSAKILCRRYPECSVRKLPFVFLEGDYE